MKPTPLLVGLLVVLNACPAWSDPVAIRLDASDTGRRFDGIGAVSAGASTRNLVDYPAKERGEVLDYLFKPRFGAGLQHLKVEIGGGDNSTCGSEPSHAITREELGNPRARGYEFWFMAEARKRNPHILLDCLAWCYPGWLSGRFSQDSADWYAAFLDVARKQYGLELDWLAASHNEMGFDLNWVAHTVRPTLDARGYSHVHLQGPDINNAHWKIFADLTKNPAAGKVIEAVGYHYPSVWTPRLEDNSRAATEEAKASGKPLWSSEEFSYSGKTWDKALLWAQLINKNYIRDRITKTEAWSPIDSIYPGVPYAGVGLMQASSPWSAHYEVWPAVWTTAHTTQFADLGWRYLDHACGQFDPKTWTGSFVALRDPAGSDWSMVVCTAAAAAVQIEVAPNLKQGPVHVWKSDAQAQFVQGPDVPVVAGKLAVSFEPDAVYSLTTTTGQQKGAYPDSPAAKPFPLPYAENFDTYPAGVTPRYFSDQKGTFETAPRPGGGICLQQIVPAQGIQWFRKYRIPYTVWGDNDWKDYTAQAEVLVKDGSVEIGGRFGDPDLLNTALALAHDGGWNLGYWEKIKGEGADKAGSNVFHALAQGKLGAFDAARWHVLKIAFQGKRVSAFIDGQPVAQAEDPGRKNGMAYLASSYDPNCFDNVSVEPVMN